MIINHAVANLKTLSTEISIHVYKHIYIFTYIKNHCCTVQHKYTFKADETKRTLTIFWSDTYLITLYAIMLPEHDVIMQNADEKKVLANCTKRNSEKKGSAGCRLIATVVAVVVTAIIIGIIMIMANGMIDRSSSQLLHCAFPITCHHRHVICMF